MPKDAPAMKTGLDDRKKLGIGSVELAWRTPANDPPSGHLPTLTATSGRSKDTVSAPHRLTKPDVGSKFDFLAGGRPSGASVRFIAHGVGGDRLSKFKARARGLALSTSPYIGPKPDTVAGGVVARISN